MRSVGAQVDVYEQAAHLGEVGAGVAIVAIVHPAAASTLGVWGCAGPLVPASLAATPAHRGARGWRPQWRVGRRGRPARTPPSTIASNTRCGSVTADRRAAACGRCAHGVRRETPMSKNSATITHDRSPGSARSPAASETITPDPESPRWTSGHRTQT
ncbi:MAG: hypothetical protein ACRDRN_08125 [Sciscionella sp.]